MPGAKEGEAACRGQRGGGSASPSIKEGSSKNRPAAILRRPSGAEEGEAACRGQRGGGSASPTIKETQSLSKNCSGSEFP